jgi:dihydrodipicolinate synthase/N-acetylneuraminate lyase
MSPTKAENLVTVAQCQRKIAGLYYDRAHEAIGMARDARERGAVDAVFVVEACYWHRHARGWLHAAAATALLISSACVRQTPPLAESVCDPDEPRILTDGKAHCAKAGAP